MEVSDCHLQRARVVKRNQVSFELSSDELRILRAIQVLDGGKSPSGAARTIVRQHLEARATDDLVRRQLELLPQEVPEPAQGG